MVTAVTLNAGTVPQIDAWNQHPDVPPSITWAGQDVRARLNLNNFYDPVTNEAVPLFPTHNTVTNIVGDGLDVNLPSGARFYRGQVANQAVLDAGAFGAQLASYAAQGIVDVIQN